MGKERKGQRTKGNARPSSSARAAEELAASGATGGFIGFGALSGDLGYVPASPGLTGDDDYGADADFRLVLRKVSKRDATTKLKALQEFAALCREKPVEDVKSVLPFWPRIYSKVSIDFDRRVREACQQGFEQIVLRVRRNLAPHLKSLMGPWVVSQCDIYAPAASAAKVAFQTAFPPAKQTEALLYCKEEILQHICENVFKQTAQTLSDPKTTEPEDMEAKYLRVVTSSLLGIRLFMTSVPKEEQDSLMDRYRGILKEGKFWKLAKHSSNMIRAAFYSALASLCQIHPELANEFSDKICPAVLNNLDETDPSVGPAIWESTLYVVSTVNNCWDKVNARKGVLPKLWTVFKNGGNGCASVIYPNLLPLLGKIPKEIIGDDTGFYKAWFDNLKLGLSLEKVLVSPSESNAIVKCYMECLKYCVHHSITENNATIAEFLIQDQLIPVLEASWTEKKPALLNTSLYRAVVELALSLYKVSMGPAPKSKSGNKTKNVFWDTLTSLIMDKVREGSNDNYMLQRIGTFVCTFTGDSTTPAKKSVRIKFSMSDDTEPENSEFVTESSSKLSIPETELEYLTITDNDSALTGLVGKMCKESVQKSQDPASPSLNHVKLLDQLFKSYMSDDLITTVSRNLNLSSADNMAVGPMPFLELSVLPWVQNVEGSDLSAGIKDGYVQTLVDVTISVSKLITSSQKINLLSHILKSSSTSTLHKYVVEFARQADTGVIKWYKGEEFGKKMVQVAETLCQHSLSETDTSEQDISASWALLTMAMSTNVEFEPVIDCKFMEEILLVIRRALPSPGNLTDIHRTYACVSFVCRVSAMFFTNIKGCLMIQSAEELLLSVTQLMCHQSLSLSDDILETVLETCDLGIKSLLYQKGGFLNEEGFFAKIATHIKFQVLNTADSLERVCLLGRISKHICNCMAQYFVDQNVSSEKPNGSVVGFIKLLEMPFMHSMTPQWSNAVIVSNELLLSSLPDSPLVVSDKLPTCLAAIAFTSSLLTSVPCTESSEEEPSPFLYTILDMLYGVSFCQSVLSQCRTGVDKSEISMVSELLDKNIDQLIDIMQEKDVKLLCLESLDKSMCNGQLWSLCLKSLATKLRMKRLTLNWLEMAGGSERFCILVEPTVNTLQSLMPFLSKSETTQFAEIQAAQIMSCDPIIISSTQGGAGYLSIFNAALSLQDTPMGDLPLDLNPEVVLGVLAEVQLWREQNDDLFLFDTSVRSKDWSLVSFNVQTLQLMTLAVERLPIKLKDGHWDFIMCSLVSWVQSCQESTQDLDDDLPTKAFCTHVFSLVAAVARCIQTILPQNPDDFPPNLATEWDEFFSESAYSVILPIFVVKSGNEKESAADEIVTRSICLAASKSPAEHVKSHQLPAKLVAGDDTHLPDEMQTLLNHICPLLASPKRPVQLAAYRILSRVMSDLSKFDEGHECSEDSDGRGESTRSLPPALVSVLDTCTQGTGLTLGDTPMGEACVLEPGTIGHSHSLGYLFTWKLILSFFKGASSELRAQYAYYMREKKAVDVLMLNLFRLMPEHPIINLKESLTSQNASKKLLGTMNLFSEEPLLDIKEIGSSIELGHLACSVYMWTLQDLPAIIRQWWNDQDKQTEAIVETYTMKYVTPIISSKELSLISQQDSVSDNMSIKSRPATKEVVATYTVDEVSMELVVALAGNHPLGSIAVESGRRVGVANQEWRNWMLQLTTYLNHQNGTILDGLSLWKRNVDKKFEGIEECFICFSVINATNCQLPKPQCKTCKKRFHSACLYKWFNTSNKSTCPLCRNLF